MGHRSCYASRLDKKLSMANQAFHILLRMELSMRISKVIFRHVRRTGNCTCSKASAKALLQGSGEARLNMILRSDIPCFISYSVLFGNFFAASG